MNIFLPSHLQKTSADQSAGLGAKQPEGQTERNWPQDLVVNTRIIWIRPHKSTSQ